MKIFGHPIHIMLIHFPSALFPMDLACSSIYFFTKNPSFTSASFYAMSGGVVLGWFAVLFGTFDLLIIAEKKTYLVKKTLLHGCINIIVVIIYTILAYMQYRHYPLQEPDKSWSWLLKVFTICFMITGNFIGGNLILKHKVAIEDE